MKRLERLHHSELQVGDLVAIPEFIDDGGEGHYRPFYRLIIGLGDSQLVRGENRPGVRLRVLDEAVPDYNCDWLEYCDREDWVIIRPEGEPIEWLLAHADNEVEAA